MAREHCGQCGAEVSPTLRHVDLAAHKVVEIVQLAGNIPSATISTGGSETLTNEEWWAIQDLLIAAEEALKLANLKLAKNDFDRKLSGAWETFRREQHRINGVIFS